MQLDKTALFMGMSQYLKNQFYSMHNDYFQVFGDKGMLTNGEQRPFGVQLHNEKGTTAVPIFFSFASRYQESYKAEIEHFLNVCQGESLT